MGKRVNRRRRSDRKHIIYKVTCVPTGEIYIGLTVLTGGWKKTLKSRWTRHVGRAMYHPELDWGLCRCIRKHDMGDFVVECISIIRGKAEAHLVETELIDRLSPQLNTFRKGFEKLSKK